jgi:chromosome segregation ATPase
MTLTKQNKGNFLLAIAWIIEIFAMIAGLVIAYINADIIRQQIENPSTATFVIAAIPFVMIAFVEITKIPFAYAFYYTKKLVWKFIFLASLLFLMFITFETMMNGFENNFYNINQVIETVNNKITARKNKIQNIDNKVSLIENNILITEKEYKSYIDKYYKELKEINTKDYASALKIINQEILNINKEIEIQKGEYSKQISKQEQIINNTIQRLHNDVEKDKTELNSIVKKLDESFFGDKDLSKQRDRLEIEIQSKQQQINQSNQRLNNLYSSSANLSSFYIKKEELEKQRSKLQQRVAIQKDTSIKALENDKKVKDREYSEFIKSKKNKDIEIENLSEEKNKLDDEINNLKLQIDKKTNGIQIYRLALFLYSEDCKDGDSNCKIIKHTSDLSKEQISFTATLWFGSLAAIVAWTGVLLAFAGIVLKDNESNTKKINFFRNLMFILYKFKRKVKIIEKKVIKEVPVDKIIEKEVIKEVPVDKIVFKEVPKEVVRKEYVHVPLYTNDKNLLKYATSNEIKNQNNEDK